MKFLHLSDLHLGRTLHGFSLLADQRYILEQILSAAQEESVDALLLAGDLYDKRTPSTEAVCLLDWFLTRVAQMGLPCLMVSGNHDSPERLAFGGQLLAARNVHISPVFQGALTPVTLRDEFGEVDVYLMPYLRPAHVRAVWQEEPVESFDDAIRLVLEKTHPDFSRRTVLVAHQFVTSGGASPVRCDSETISVGGLDNVDSSAFDGFSYVALGHIHGAQNMGSERVRYCGSPLKYSVSEANHKKSLTLVELDGAGEVHITTRPLHPLHDLRAIAGPLARLTAPEVVSAADAEDYLHVTLTDQSPLDAKRRLDAVYPNVLQVEFSNVTEGGELPQGEIQPQRSPLELFADFYRRQTGVELDEAGAELVRALWNEEEGDLL